jgi:hypothetical protein
LCRGSCVTSVVRGVTNGDVSQQNVRAKTNAAPDDDFRVGGQDSIK